MWRNSSADVQRSNKASEAMFLIRLLECERCMKSLDLEIVNDMTMASATRIPGTSFSLISYPLLKPVRTIFTYLIIERIGK